MYLVVCEVNAEIIGYELKILILKKIEYKINNNIVSFSDSAVNLNTFN